MHWTRVQNRDPQKTYNKLTLAELQKLAPRLDWKTWLAGTGLASQTAFNVNQPSAIAGTAKLVKSVSRSRPGSDYLTVRLLVGDGAVPAEEVRRRAVRVLRQDDDRARPENKERWKRGVDEVDRRAGRGRRQALRRQVLHGRDQGSTRTSSSTTCSPRWASALDGLTWMSAETKAKAKAKLATYNPKIGYPKQVARLLDARGPRG